MLSCRDGGLMLTYGGLSKKPVMMPTGSQIFKNVTAKGFWLSGWLLLHSRLKLLTSSIRLPKL